MATGEELKHRAMKRSVKRQTRGLLNKQEWFQLGLHWTILSF